jgi:hypothetical protein
MNIVSKIMTEYTKIISLSLVLSHVHTKPWVVQTQIVIFIMCILN